MTSVVSHDPAVTQKRSPPVAVSRVRTPLPIASNRALARWPPSRAPSRTRSGKPASPRTGARSASSCITSRACTRWRSSWHRRLPAGKPVAGRDLGCRPRDERRARQGVRRRHERGGAGSAPAQQHGSRGRDPGSQRRGARSGRSGVAQLRRPAHVPVHARGSRRPAQLSPPRPRASGVRALGHRARARGRAEGGGPRQPRAACIFSLLEPVR